ncbi:MAG: ANTAR domain-containing protein [Burkholderiaceae bacterium]|nr:ANTAR domain-containing protein [Burkholderiaceae bacterium]
MLFSPVKPFGVLSSMVLALSKRVSEEELQKRIQKLESRLENVRLIEQAKRFLMERGVSEDDAFRLLRNRAMERRCSDRRDGVEHRRGARRAGCSARRVLRPCAGGGHSGADPSHQVRRARFCRRAG